MASREHGGFKKFCSADDSVRTDISDASRPIKDKEKEMCAAAGVEYIEIPVAYDAIAQRQASPDHAVPASLIAIWLRYQLRKNIKW